MNKLSFLAGAIFLNAIAAHGGTVADVSKDSKAVAPLDPLTSWGGPIIGGGVKGNNDFIEGSLFLVEPLVNTIGTGGTMEGSVLFVEPYVTWGEEGELGASLGIGFRHLFSDQSVSDASHNTVAGFLTEGFYLGGNLFVDFARSQADNDFWQVGGGLEAGTRYLTLRANYYLPLSDDQTISRRTETTVTSSRRTSTSTAAGAPTVVNGQVVQNFRRATTTNIRTTTTTRTFELFEEPLEGFDVELALLIPGIERYCDVQLIAGYYSLEAERSHRDFKGWRAGVEIRPVPAVVLHATWFEEQNLYHDDWLVGIRLEIPLGGDIKEAFTPRRRHLAERLFEPVHRKNSSITTSGVEEEQVKTTTTTNNVNVIHQSGNQIILGPANQPPPPVPDGELEIPDNSDND